MKRILIFLLTAAMLLAADVTGKWKFQVETDMGSGSPGFDFKQVGSKLTGMYKGQLGEAPLTGTVEGDQIEFSFQVSPQGDKLTIKYKGTIEGKKMNGTLDFGGQASGKFTATKE